MVSSLGVTAIPLISNQCAIYHRARLGGREASRGIPLVIFFRERAIKLACCELALQQVLGDSTVLHPAVLASEGDGGELQQKESPFSQKEQTPATTDGELQPEPPIPPPLFFFFFFFFSRSNDEEVSSREEKINRTLRQLENCSSSETYIFIFAPSGKGGFVVVVVVFAVGSWTCARPMGPRFVIALERFDSDLGARKLMTVRILGWGGGVGECPHELHSQSHFLKELPSVAH